MTIKQADIQNIIAFWWVFYAWFLKLEYRKNKDFRFNLLVWLAHIVKASFQDIWTVKQFCLCDNVKQKLQRQLHKNFRLSAAEDIMSRQSPNFDHQDENSTEKHCQVKKAK